MWLFAAFCAALTHFFNKLIEHRRGKLCKIVARWPAKAVAQFFFVAESLKIHSCVLAFGGHLAHGLALTQIRQNDIITAHEYWIVKMDNANPGLR